MGKLGKRRKSSVGRRGSAPPMDGSGKPLLHYWSGAHTRHRVLLHLVFCPKYRLRVLEGAVASRLVSLFTQCCEVNHWYLHELNVQPDHVHLLVQVSPSERFSDVVQYLKGGSSRVIRVEFPDLVEFLWGSSFWSDGYFCESVGYRDEASVRDYIKNQRQSGAEFCGETLLLDFASSEGVFGEGENLSGTVDG
jgi:putative transposase